MEIGTWTQRILNIIKHTTDTSTRTYWRLIQWCNRYDFYINLLPINHVMANCNVTITHITITPRAHFNTFAHRTLYNKCVCPPKNDNTSGLISPVLPGWIRKETAWVLVYELTVNFSQERQHQAIFDIVVLVPIWRYGLLLYYAKHIIIFTMDHVVSKNKFHLSYSSLAYIPFSPINVVGNEIFQSKCHAT